MRSTMRGDFFNNLTCSPCHSSSKLKVAVLSPIIDPIIPRIHFFYKCWKTAFLVVPDALLLSIKMGVMGWLYFIYPGNLHNDININHLWELLQIAISLYKSQHSWWLCFVHKSTNWLGVICLLVTYIFLVQRDRIPGSSIQQLWFSTHTF